MAGKLILGNGSNVTLGGPMSVTGSASIAGSAARLLVNGKSLSIGGNLTASPQQSLRMLNTADRVTVHGSATFTGDHRSALKAGILYVRGDFTQGGNIWSFPAEGTHQTILDGAAPQTVSFADTAGYSYSVNRVQTYQKATLSLSAGSVLNNGGTARAEILNKDPAATVNGNPIVR